MMRHPTFSRPSPTIVVAVMALVAALAGTAVAEEATSAKAVTKKKVKKIADTRIEKAAPGLSVAKAETADHATNADGATNADAVDGSSASDLRTSSAFNENGTDIPSLGIVEVTVASATITTHSSGRVLATGSAELFGADSDERGLCEIAIDGVDSLHYEGEADDIGTDNQFVIAVNFARTLPAGTHTANLRCRSLGGTVGKDDAAINVYGLGT